MLCRSVRVLASLAEGMMVVEEVVEVTEDVEEVRVDGSVVVPV